MLLVIFCHFYTVMMSDVKGGSGSALILLIGSILLKSETVCQPRGTPRLSAWTATIHHLHASFRPRHQTSWTQQSFLC